jgi:hypothetical protein
MSDEYTLSARNEYQQAIEEAKARGDWRRYIEGGF